VLVALKTNTSLTSTNGSVTYDLSKVALSGDQNCPVDIGGQTATATDTIGLGGLKELANEQVYSNIGLGLSTKATVGADGKVINEQSVFNTAVPGISVIGFGTADGSGTGMSNNIYTLMGQIADQLEGKNGSTYSLDTIQPYITQFQNQQNMVISKMTETDSSFSFLKSTETNLQDIGDRILEKDDKTEYVDFEDAYLNYSMQAYAYNAALKIGNQILQPTFLDFMK
jgi:flagellin-like hook-associated protein FlgL